MTEDIAKEIKHCIDSRHIVGYNIASWHKGAEVIAA